MKEMTFPKLAILAGLLLTVRLASGAPVPPGPDLSEPLTELRVPAETLNGAVTTALQSGITTILKRWDGIEISPSGLITVGGQIEIPESLVNFLGMTEGAKKLLLVDIQLSFTPGVKNYQDHSWATLRFESIRINSQEIIQTTPIVANLIGFLLMQPRLAQWISTSDTSSNPEAGTSSKSPTKDVKTQITDFVSQKNIRFVEETNTLLVRLDFEQFAGFFALPKFKATDPLMERLQLWSFSPLKFDHSEESFLYIVLGWGPPPAKWMNTFKDRTDRDVQESQALQNHVRERLPDPARVYNQFQAAFNLRMQEAKLGPLSVREQKQVELFLLQTNEQINSTLKPDNPRFRVNPKEEFNRLEQSVTSAGRLFILNLRHQQDVFHTLAKTAEELGLKEKGTWPFITQSLSQKTISGAIRFFRDIEIKDQSIFSSFSIALNPSLPGLIISGQLNTGSENLNVLSQGAISPSSETQLLGGRLPFELALRLYMQPDGWLRIDPQRLVLFRGKQALALTTDQKNGRLIFSIVLNLIEKTLAPMILDVGPTTLDQDAEAQRLAEVKLARQYLTTLVPSYNKILGGSTKFESNHALQLIDADLRGNPHLQSGRRYLQTQMKKLNARDYIHTDSRGILIYPNPQLLALFVQPLEKGDLYVWNAEPVYRPQYGKSYIDISVGTGPRSKRYGEFLQKRKENADSQSFTKEEGALRDTPDFILGLNFNNLAHMISLLADDYARATRERVEKALQKDEALQDFIVSNVKLGVSAENQLTAAMDIEWINKTKYAFYNPSGWLTSKWKVSRIPLKLQLKLSLDMAELASYPSLFSKDDSAIFMGGKALRVNLTDLGVITDRFSFWQTILSWIPFLHLNIQNIDLNHSWIGSAIKAGIVKKIGAMFDDPLHAGDTELGGFAVNRYARIYTPGTEILIQFNPRMISPAFEASLVSLGEKPISVDPKYNSLKIGFRTEAVMANVDKTEVFQIIRKIRESFSPYLKTSDRVQLAKLCSDGALFSTVLRSVDRTKPSLYYRYIRLLKLYPEVGQFTLPEEGQVGENERGPKEAAQNSLTETGSELVYFLCVAMCLHQELTLLIDRADSLQARDVVHYNDFAQYRDNIMKRIIVPLWDRYKIKHLARNHAIAQRGITGWTESFYSEAVFADVLAQIFATELK